MGCICPPVKQQKQRLAVREQTADTYHNVNYRGTTTYKDKEFLPVQVPPSNKINRIKQSSSSNRHENTIRKYQEQQENKKQIKIQKQKRQYLADQSSKLVAKNKLDQQTKYLNRYDDKNTSVKPIIKDRSRQYLTQNSYKYPKQALVSQTTTTLVANPRLSRKFSSPKATEPNPKSKSKSKPKNVQKITSKSKIKETRVIVDPSPVKTKKCYPYTKQMARQLFRTKDAHSNNYCFEEAKQIIEQFLNNMKQYGYKFQIVYTSLGQFKKMNRKVYLFFSCLHCKREWTSILGNVQVKFFVLNKNSQNCNINWNLKIYSEKCKSCQVWGIPKIFHSQLQACKYELGRIITQISDDVAPEVYQKDRFKIVENHFHLQELCEACQNGKCFNMPK